MRAHPLSAARYNANLMLRIRRADHNEADALYALASAFATSFTVERSSFEASLAALIASPDAFLAVASDDGRAVGYVLGFDHPTFYANGKSRGSRKSWSPSLIAVAASADS
jgi:hypothetical protein